MKTLVLLILAVMMTPTYGQHYSINYETIELENKKSGLYIDTLICDTIVKYEAPIYGCVLPNAEYKDTTVARQDSLFQISILCTPHPQKGLNLTYTQKGQRESLGFVGTKYIISQKWPFIMKMYVKKGLWVIYNGGKFRHSWCYHQEKQRPKAWSNIVLFRPTQNSFCPYLFCLFHKNGTMKIEHPLPALPGTVFPCIGLYYL